MYVCMYVCMYAYVRTYVTCVRTLRAYMHACMHACTHVRLYVRTYVCMYEGVQYIMATHSKLSPQARKNSITYTEQKIRALAFQWCIEFYSIFLTFLIIDY